MKKPRLFYAIKEIFLTVQGEATFAGARAVFVRTAGCNVWSGREEDRTRDISKGCCAAWCDTDFTGTDGTNGGKYTAKHLVEKIRHLWGPMGEALVVITGGEPSLQVDDALVDALHEANIRIHIETNGSHPLPGRVDWVTLSPKPPMPVVDQRYDEVKIVYPTGIDPCLYASRVGPYHRFIQPLDDPFTPPDAKSPFFYAGQCLEFIERNPTWRLSVQLHKAIGVP